MAFKLLEFNRKRQHPEKLIWLWHFLPTGFIVKSTKVGCALQLLIAMSNIFIRFQNTAPVFNIAIYAYNLVFIHFRHRHEKSDPDQIIEDKGIRENNFLYIVIGLKTLIKIINKHNNIWFDRYIFDNLR